MALLAKESKSYDPIPADIHHAIAVWLYDIGTTENKWGKKSRRVVISWELPDVRIQIDHEGVVLDLPRMFSRTYPLTLGKKAGLRKDLETWRGRAFSAEELKGFDVKNVLGKNCMLQIIHETKEDGDIKAKLLSIIPLVKGLTGKTPETDIRYFEFGASNEIPENTPEWIVEEMKKSDEWQQFGKTLAGTEGEPKKPAFMTEAAAPPADSNGDTEIPF